MKLAIIGSRTIKDEQIVWNAIYNFIRDHVFEGTAVTLISGGADGVDSFARSYAKKWCLDHVEFIPYFKLDDNASYSARHFFIRNKQIIDNADKVLAIWNGHSTGTKHAIKYAQKTGKPIMVIKKHEH